MIRFYPWVYSKIYKVAFETARHKSTTTTLEIAVTDINGLIKLFSSFLVWAVVISSSRASQEYNSCYRLMYLSFSFCHSYITTVQPFESRYSYLKTAPTRKTLTQY